MRNPALPETLVVGGKSSVIIQYAWVVADLDKAIVSWVERLGIGPFLVLRNVAVSGSLYRGRSVDTHHSVAMAQVGDAQIELIQVHSQPPNVYSEFLGPGGVGFHHVAILAEDFDATVEAWQREGVDIAQRHDYRGTRLCYLDARDSLGFYVEVLEHTPLVRELLATVKAAHASWDGVTDTIRALLLGNPGD